MSALSRRAPVTGVLAALVASVVLLVQQTGQPVPAASATDQAAAQQQPMYVYRVAGAVRDSDRLFGLGSDVLEHRDGDDLFVLGSKQEGALLRQSGFTATVESVMPPAPWTPPKKHSATETLSASDADETYYGGYRTVRAHYAHLDNVASQYSALTSLVTYGESWRKSKGMANGYDLKAVCITKKTAADCKLEPNSAKPRFFLMSQIHAREITTGDMAWRWIDHLVQNYGKDAEVTALMDSTEMWVVPMVNPDGVEVVQQGGNSPRLHRKNANDSKGNCGPDGHFGVDLNRNFGTHWGEAGTTTQPCGETYLGTAADSETETKALESLFGKLYPDKRGTGDGTPAAADTTGMMITMHAYANGIILPWSFNGNSKTGNDTSLRKLAADMAQLTGFQYGQAKEIVGYNAAGGTDDWLYDKLGVPSFTFEIGNQQGATCGGFIPAYSCQSSTHWPKMKPALMYAAKKAANPYRDGTPPTGKKFENGADFAIKDFTTVESPVEVTGVAGNAPQELKVAVDIKHSYRGDLRIDLIAPDGTGYLLKDYSSDSAANVNTTYTVNAAAETANGTWKLRVRDNYSGDTGSLDLWSLQF